MRRLSVLLIALNVGLVVATVAAVAWAASTLLGSLGDEQARARVGLAAVAAREAVEHSGEILATSAHVLAERPTLNRLLAEGDAAGLAAFLERFGATSAMDGCAVWSGGRLAARAGEALPWEALRAARRDPGDTLLFQTAGGGLLIQAAASAVSSVPDADVLVARRLGPAFEAEISEQAGLPIRILPRAAVPETPPERRAAIAAEALSTEAPASGRDDAAGLYVAVHPLATASAGIVGVVEASLPTAGVGASVHALVRALVLLAIAVAAIATVVSFLIARRIGRPVEILTEAAARIGRGDLGTPIPRAGGLEVDTLAATMEEMRGRLLGLTAELGRRRAEAEAVLNGIVEGVFTVDRERRVRYMNPQAAALLGIDAAASVGRFCGDVLRPQLPGGGRPCEDDCPILHARFRGGARSTEHLAPAPGVRRTVVVTSAPPAAEASGGEAAGEAAQFQLLRDETEVEATRRLRDAVLANVSHEFRTPLSAQLASIELLRERLPATGAGEARELVASLERGALRLTVLIDNLLESVRIEAGEVSIRRVPVHIDEVVEEAVEMTAPLIARRGQRIETDLPYPMPVLLGDAPRLAQVLVNLIANAGKFAPEGSVVRIGGSAGDGTATVWVEDEGPGFPPEAGESIFERFRRAPAGEPEAGGMGLGLWIVKSIVERHGGRVEARTLERGARVSVVLPAGVGGEDPRR